MYYSLLQNCFVRSLTYYHRSQFRDSSVNDSGVVGDHDQDSLYDLTIGNVEIINCKEKDRKPSKIDIPFVVSIGKFYNLNLFTYLYFIG